MAATPPGGGVRVACWAEGGRALVRVSDTGVGLARQDLERVFERFYRADRSTGGRDGGSGIGLTIARGIASAHGGDLTAASAGPGTGASFTLDMPIAATRRG